MHLEMELCKFEANFLGELLKSSIDFRTKSIVFFDLDFVTCFIPDLTLSFFIENTECFQRIAKIR